jgi:hypothetical protein
LSYQIWVGFIFVYQKSFYNERLKPVFEYKITFWICVLVLWMHKGYCVVKELVWNVRIKAFWYTKKIAIKIRTFLSYSIILLELLMFIYFYFILAPRRYIIPKSSKFEWVWRVWSCLGTKGTLHMHFSTYRTFSYKFIK